MNLSRKQHLILIAITVIILNSCNYWVAKEDIKKQEKEVFVKKVASNKQQAKKLVYTAENIIDVIKLCTVLKNYDIDNSTKNQIERIQRNQENLLAKIKEVSNDAMVSVPSTLEITTKKLEDKGLETNLKVLKEKINNQKKLFLQLKDSKPSTTITILSDSLIPNINQYLNELETLTSK